MKYLKRIILTLILIYFIGINYYSYLEMREDKQKAVKKERRTSEQDLFSLAAMGGAIGTEIAMYDFPSGYYKHKVSKASWRIGIPSLIINHFFIIALLIFLVFKFKPFLKNFLVIKDSSTGKSFYLKIDKKQNRKFIMESLPEDIIVKNEFHIIKSAKNPSLKKIK
ncbi:MAG: DUF1294 domain-containing protein [Chlorobi bacterium]|nr:DUF1294 domain-containing protein [Chlorobiota bacterium]